MRRKEVLSGVPLKPEETNFLAQAIEHLTKPILSSRHYQGEVQSFRETFPRYITPERSESLEESYLLHPFSFCRFLHQKTGKSWPEIFLRSFAAGHLRDKETSKLYDNSPTIFFNLGLIDLVSAAQICRFQSWSSIFTAGAIVITANLATLAAIKANRYHEVCHGLSFWDPQTQRSGIAKGGENATFNEVLTNKFAEVAMKRAGLTPWISCLAEKLFLYPGARRVWNKVEAILTHSYGLVERERLITEAYWNGKLEELTLAFNCASHRGKETFQDLSQKAGSSPD